MLPPQAQPGLRQGLICSKELPELSLGPNMGAEGSPASTPTASSPDSEGPPGGLGYTPAVPTCVVSCWGHTCLPAHTRVHPQKRAGFTQPVRFYAASWFGG